MEALRNRRGYSQTELAIVLACLGMLGLLGVAGYVVWHFVAKFW